MKEVRILPKALDWSMVARKLDQNWGVAKRLINGSHIHLGDHRSNI